MGCRYCIQICNLDQKIELPRSLTHLEFGYNFTQEIKENTLPQSLTHLIVNEYFDQLIEENALPLNLTCLKYKW